MKKNFRQLLALFLCLVFVFSVLPTVAMAEGETVPEQTQTEEDLQLNDDGNFVGGEDDGGGDTSLGGDNGLIHRAEIDAELVVFDSGNVVFE